MTKDPQIFLRHIRDSVELIENYSKNLTKSKFLKNATKQDALVRRIEIIGEATKNIPATFKNKYPKTPWKKIAGMRNKVIHEYFGVDLDLVWDVVKKDIPHLKREILKMLEGK